MKWRGCHHLMYQPNLVTPLWVPFFAHDPCTLRWRLPLFQGTLQMVSCLHWSVWFHRPPHLPWLGPQGVLSCCTRGPQSHRDRWRCVRLVAPERCTLAERSADTAEREKKSPQQFPAGEKGMNNHHALTQRERNEQSHHALTQRETNEQSLNTDLVSWDQLPPDQLSSNQLSRDQFVTNFSCT